MRARTRRQRFDIVKLRLAGGRTAFDATLEDQVHSFPLNKEFYPLSPSANQASVEAGMDAHVGKPFDINTLVDVLLRCTSGVAT